MAGKLPRLEWMRVEYWKEYRRLNGADSCLPDGDKAHPPQHNGFGPARDSSASKSAIGHVKQLERRVEAEENLSLEEKAEWLCVLDLMRSDRPATRGMGLKLFGPLQARLPLASANLRKTKRDEEMNPAELGRKLDQDRREAAALLLAQVEKQG